MTGFYDWLIARPARCMSGISGDEGPKVAAPAGPYVAPQLGDRVADPITGITGIVSSVTTWLHGCIRVSIQPEEFKDGAPVDLVHFDQSQVIVLNQRVHTPMTMGVIAVPAETRRSNGGPRRETAGFSR